MGASIHTLAIFVWVKIRILLESTHINLVTAHSNFKTGIWGFSSQLGLLKSTQALYLSENMIRSYAMQELDLYIPD